MKCSFCHNKDIENRTISENEHAFAFPSNIPIVPGHTLICPKRCVSKIDDLSSDEWKSIWKLIKALKTALKKSFLAEGFNYSLNEGEIAGQSMKHVHFHLLPRKEGDTGITKYEPRKFLYRPGSRKESPEKELMDVARIIREFMD